MKNKKYILIISILFLFFSLPASAVTLFSENFNTGNKGTFNTCTAQVLFQQSSKIYSANMSYSNAECTSSTLPLFSAFSLSIDANLSYTGTDYYFSMDVKNTSSSNYFYFYFLNSSYDLAYLEIGYVNNVGSWVYIDEYIDLNNYLISGWVNVRADRINNNVYIYINNNLFKSYILINPHSSNNNLDLIRLNGDGTGHVSLDTVLLYDTYPVPSISSTCSQLDLSGISWYDLPSLIGAILAWLYSAPACYYQSFIDWMYTFLEDIFYIPNGILNSFLWNINRIYTDMIGSIHSMSNLMSNVTHMLENSLYFMIDNAWAGIIATGFTLVISLRIYSFLKDVSIAGFKI